MKFNKEQETKMANFISKYNSTEEEKQDIQKTYANTPSQLSILEIYILEEILRYGTKNIYTNLLKKTTSQPEETTIQFYDQFAELYRTDDGFKQYKVQQIVENHDSLSAIELYYLQLALMEVKNQKKLHEEFTNQLSYQPLNPILFETEHQIKETIFNLLIGRFIHDFLQFPANKPIAVRQKVNGMIADSDRQLIINSIRIGLDGQIDQLINKIDEKYIYTKFNLLLGKGEDAFQDLQYNTNISAHEVLEKEIQNRKNKAR